MRRLLSCILAAAALCCGGAAFAQPAGQRFVAVAFHDVVDSKDELETDAVTTRTLVQFFDWLKGTGWTPITLDDLAAAHEGRRKLPDKAILLSVDDGYKSLYTRIYPLLRVYRYPMVAALVGSWMENRPDARVLYGTRLVPRSDFISWAEAREMQASGLVEFASHSYGLHAGVRGNPQGNELPAAITWRYDPATGTYEDDAQHRARIRTDLERSRTAMAAELGRPPRALVWPFGRYSGPALDVAKQAGFRFALTLEPQFAYTSDLFAIHRHFPTENPALADILRDTRFEPGRPGVTRIACLRIDALAERSGAAQDALLGEMIEGVRALGANYIVIDGHAALPAADAPLGDVFFPTRLRPLRADLLSRVAWQLRSRAGVDVYLRLPLGAAAAAVGEANVPALFADMARRAPSDGVALDFRPPPGSALAGDDPGLIRAKRAALHAGDLDRASRLALEAFRGAAAIDPRKRLMALLSAPQGPPDWADIAVLPPAADPRGTAALAARLADEGWLWPDAAARTAISLPAIQPVEAMRAAQRKGVAAFALCPQPTVLPASPALAATFSASTYPYRP